MITWILRILEPLVALYDYLKNGHDWLRMHWDRLRGYPKMRRDFLRVVGYAPNLEVPRSVNEKILWRKINDHAPVYTVISDKYRLKDYLAHRFGAKRAEEWMPKWRLVTARPTAAALRAAGTGVVIKPNHASGWLEIVPKGSAPDWQRLAWTARRWMRRRYGLSRHESPYRGIKALTLVEDLVLDADGQPAMDVKFHVMDGRCIWVLVAYDRHKEMRIAQASRDWQKIHTSSRNYTHGALPDKPAYYLQLLALAEEIGRDFDYIRVDFLCGATDWRLNELTLHESSGLVASNDINLAVARGDLWKHRRYDGVWGKSAPYDDERNFCSKP